MPSTAVRPIRLFAVRREALSQMSYDTSGTTVPAPCAARFVRETAATRFVGSYGLLPWCHASRLDNKGIPSSTRTNLVYLVGRERRSFVPVMPRLPPNLGLSASSLLARLTTWLDDIARGWLGGIAGMLLRLGQLLLQRSDQRFQCGNARPSSAHRGHPFSVLAFRHDGG